MLMLNSPIQEDESDGLIHEAFIGFAESQHCLIGFAESQHCLISIANASIAFVSQAGESHMQAYKDRL